MQQLVTILTAKQKTASQSDTAFARNLNVSRQTWGCLKRGQRRMGDKVLNCILKTYPELAPEILDFIRNNHSHPD